MKKMKRLSAAVALALSVGLASQTAQAEIILKHNGKGDALLFPVYNAYVENYFTISNNENQWIQGHIRFRGAAWSGELLDFDVILSPGDVFVFRIADVDGDGHWEIDQTMDPSNFKYTAKVSSCKHTVPDTAAPGEDQSNCMDFGTVLVPSTRNNVISDAVVDHHLKVGYIEFIGEAVLDGMTGDIMTALLSDKPGQYQNYQTKQANQRGVTAWSWSDAANQFANDMGLSDVPNALSGTAFISIPGASHGLAYNAEAFVNFRTAGKHGLQAHRIENYRMFHDPKMGMYTSIDTDPQVIDNNRAVIVHDENVSGTGLAVPFKPYGDYVLRYENYGAVPGISEDREDEARMSFQNTWGPTLADGDDYELMGIRPTYNDDPQEDDFDANWLTVGAGNPSYGYGSPNSIAEIEEAIRDGGQIFTSYYFDGDMLKYSDVGLQSQYFAFFPTKVFWSELYDHYKASDFNQYLERSVMWLLSKPKPYRLEVWDNFEREACTVPPPEGGFVSPYQPGSGGSCAASGSAANGSAANGSATTGSTNPACNTNQVPCFTFLGHELTFLSIVNVKSSFPSISGTGLDVNKDFKAGRVVFNPPEDANNAYRNDLRQSWPALMYTFELGNDWSLSHWRSLQR